MVCIVSQELIQNADDAGATEVKFLFDSRDNAFGTSSLVNIGLSKFQGPALYVYNNALFKAQDWVGIESIMQGSKKTDPVAAGRFGVGFNSVYHVTGRIYNEVNHTDIRKLKQTTTIAKATSPKKGLMSNPIAAHVCFKSLNSSLHPPPSPCKTTGSLIRKPRRRRGRKRPLKNNVIFYLRIS